MPAPHPLVVAVAVLQFGAAQADIRRRGPDQLDGQRWLWVAASFINFAGPISFLVSGRRRRRRPEPGDRGPSRSLVGSPVWCSAGA